MIFSRNINVTSSSFNCIPHWTPTQNKGTQRRHSPPLICELHILWSVMSYSGFPLGLVNLLLLLGYIWWPGFGCAWSRKGSHFQASVVEAPLRALRHQKGPTQRDYCQVVYDSNVAVHGNPYQDVVVMSCRDYLAEIHLVQNNIGNTGTLTLHTTLYLHT